MNYERKRRAILVAITILIVILSVALIQYIITNANDHNIVLPADTCIYDNKNYMTCGTSFIMLSEREEYQLTANEPFYFPQGENKLIALGDISRPEGNNTFLLFLEKGEHIINKENSKKAVGSYIAKG